MNSGGLWWVFLFFVLLFCFAGGWGVYYFGSPVYFVGLSFVAGLCCGVFWVVGLLGSYAKYCKFLQV
jgi:hypothetical protein